LKVSIITVVYNSVNTIEKTIQSVLAQSHKNIEYIIIDAKSTDGTLEIIKKYEPQIQVIVSEPDSGFYEGLNKGIKLASGNIIGCLNADDRFSNTNIIEKIVAVFSQNLSLESIIGDIAFANQQNKISRYYSGSKFNINLFQWGVMPPHPSFYCKKSVFNRLGLYNENFKIAGDFELMLRFLWKNKISYQYVPLLMVYMRKGGKSTSSIFTNLFVINPEVINACKLNGLKTHLVKISMKYFLKINQFFATK
jgi:glycosyltransferase involved in cell wall biosynthesis